VSQIDNPDLNIYIGDFAPDLTECFVVDGRYHIKQNYIFYENKYKFATWKVEIDGLESPRTDIRIKSNSFGKVVFPGDTLYMLIRYKLAAKGYSMIHGSGVGLGNKGYIFSARGGTGKTITAINLVKKGFDYYSDDSVILGKSVFFGFIAPFNLRFNYDVERLLGIHFSTAVRLDTTLKKLLYYLTLKKISLFANLNPEDVFRNSIKDSTYLSRVFALTQGPEFKIRNNLSQEIIAKKLFLNVWFESSELFALLCAYNFIFPESSLIDFWENVYDSILENIQAAECCEVTLPPVYSHDIFERFFTECFAQ
jgi:hypothetical protein